MATGVEPKEERREVVDGASEAAREAVPAVVVELEAGVVVVVQSGSHGGAYAAEVKERVKSRIALLRTSYP